MSLVNATKLHRELRAAGLALLCFALLAALALGVRAQDDPPAPFDASALDAELRAAGVPFDGCSSDGRVDFRTEATAEHRAEAERVKARHDKAAAVVAARRPVARYLEVCGALRVARAEALTEADPAVKAVLNAAITRLEAEKSDLRARLK